jgi:hypothetical protein
MNSMTTISIFFGIMLNLVGLAGFLGTGSTHPTALIPCALGILLIVCGWISRNPKLHMHAMHAAVLVGTIGFAATISAFGSLKLVLSHGAGVKAPAYISKMTTALLCGLFVARCIQSFVEARLAKRAGNSGYQS